MLELLFGCAIRQQIRDRCPPDDVRQTYDLADHLTSDQRTDLLDMWVILRCPRATKLSCGNRCSERHSAQHAAVGEAPIPLMEPGQQALPRGRSRR
jgi:hypothetical protein